MSAVLRWFCPPPLSRERGPWCQDLLCWGHRVRKTHLLVAEVMGWGAGFEDPLVLPPDEFSEFLTAAAFALDELGHGALVGRCPVIDVVLGFLLWTALAAAVVMVVGQWRLRRALRAVAWCSCGWITIPAGWDQVHDVGAHMQHTTTCCQPCWEVLT